jgi:hypothetical protein
MTNHETSPNSIEMEKEFLEHAQHIIEVSQDAKECCADLNMSGNMHSGEHRITI